VRIGILLAAAAAAPAAAQTSVEASTGVEYQQGDYGTGESLETLSVPNAVRLKSGRVTLGASLPWQRIEGPGNAVGGGGGLLGLPIVIDPTRPPARIARQGIGDLRLGAAYSVPAESLGGVGLTLSGQMKVPTASARKGLGTGAADYTVGAEISTAVGGLTPFAGIAYTMPGDPAGFDLRDSLSARAGATLGLSERARGHLSYGYARGLSRLTPDEQQIASGVSFDLSGRLSLGIHGAAGLSEGSPDLGVGLQLGIRM
jgi:hypothetical protein